MSATISYATLVAAYATRDPGPFEALAATHRDEWPEGVEESAYDRDHRMMEISIDGLPVAEIGWTICGRPPPAGGGTYIAYSVTRWFSEAEADALIEERAEALARWQAIREARITRAQADIRRSGFLWWRYEPEDFHEDEGGVYLFPYVSAIDLFGRLNAPASDEATQRRVGKAIAREMRRWYWNRGSACPVDEDGLWRTVPRTVNSPARRPRSRQELARAGKVERLPESLDLATAWGIH